ncbi:MAG: hypothetical protein SFU98_14590 [Leptospiraceae bacterium]|nr:hypothetical protein [Leptospiraceae bacterium]
MNNLLEKEKFIQFGKMLRFWRKTNRLSQMDLAFDIEISPKHLSFLETGKSKPSHNLVLKITDCLRLPLRQRNAFLVAAGFAPVFKEEAFNGKNFLVIREALEHILKKHEPYPAIVVNTSYKILMKNSGYDRVIKLFSNNNSLEKYDNSMRVLFSRDGLHQYINNWSVIEFFLLSRIKEEILSSQNEELISLYSEISKEIKQERPNDFKLNSDLPIITLVFEKKPIRASFFTTIATLGTPLDITTQELRIELFFPSDEKTKELFNEKFDC